MSGPPPSEAAQAAALQFKLNLLNHFRSLIAAKNYQKLAELHRRHAACANILRNLFETLTYADRHAFFLFLVAHQLWDVLDYQLENEMMASEFYRTSLPADTDIERIKMLRQGIDILTQLYRHDKSQEHLKEYVEKASILMCYLTLKPIKLTADGPAHVMPIVDLYRLLSHAAKTRFFLVLLMIAHNPVIKDFIFGKAVNLSREDGVMMLKLKPDCVLALANHIIKQANRQLILEYYQHCEVLREMVLLNRESPVFTHQDYANWLSVWFQLDNPAITEQLLRSERFISQFGAGSTMQLLRHIDVLSTPVLRLFKMLSEKKERGKALLRLFFNATVGFWQSTILSGWLKDKAFINLLNFVISVHHYNFLERLILMRPNAVELLTSPELAKSFPVTNYVSLFMGLLRAKKCVPMAILMWMKPHFKEVFLKTELSMMQKLDLFLLLIARQEWFVALQLLEDKYGFFEAFRKTQLKNEHGQCVIKSVSLTAIVEVMQSSKKPEAKKLLKILVDEFDVFKAQVEPHKRAAALVPQKPVFATVIAEQLKAKADEEASDNQSVPRKRVKTSKDVTDLSKGVVI